MFGTVKSQSDNSAFPIDYRALNRGIFKWMFMFHRKENPSKDYGAIPVKLTSSSWTLIRFLEQFLLCSIFMQLTVFDESQKEHLNIPVFSDPEERETLISFDQIKRNGPGNKSKRISVIVWRPGIRHLTDNMEKHGGGRLIKTLYKSFHLRVKL